jgi:hypothetical protein
MGKDLIAIKDQQVSFKVSQVRRIKDMFKLKAKVKVIIASTDSKLKA